MIDLDQPWIYLESEDRPVSPRTILEHFQAFTILEMAGTTAAIDAATADVEALGLDMWEMDNLGCKLTCGETEALVKLFLSVGLVGHAAALAASHLPGEDGGDDHYDPRFSKYRDLTDESEDA